MALTGCDTRDTGSGVDLTVTAVDDDSRAMPVPAGELEGRIEDRVREWFVGTADPSRSSSRLQTFLGHDAVTLRSEERTIEGGENLLAWAATPHDRFARLEFEIGAIEIAHEDPATIRARFALVRRAWDDEGLLHLATTRHSWRIRIDPRNELVLMEADESTTLPHLGTGTKILCL